MLESLYRLVVPLVRAKDDKELSKGTLIRESKAAQKSAAERRREIDPIELEKSCTFITDAFSASSIISWTSFP